MGVQPAPPPQALTRGSGGRSREWQRVPFHVSCARHLTERLTQPGTGASHHFCSKVLSKGRGAVPSTPSERLGCCNLTRPARSRGEQRGCQGRGPERQARAPPHTHSHASTGHAHRTGADERQTGRGGSKTVGDESKPGLRDSARGREGAI